jgi:hypothetical protein
MQMFHNNCSNTLYITVNKKTVIFRSKTVYTGPLPQLYGSFLHIFQLRFFQIIILQTFLIAIIINNHNKKWNLYIHIMFTEHSITHLLQSPALSFPRVIIISPFFKTIYNKIVVHFYICWNNFQSEKWCTVNITVTDLRTPYKHSHYN